ncbi:MAG: hypothetical protein ACI3ZS_01075 [Candidatus Cryptobacteroides sp.]
MKKIIISIAALVVAAAATVAMVSRSESDSLFEANVEALASGENVVSVPCIQAVSVCTFLTKDASGNYFTSSITGMKNV